MDLSRTDASKDGAQEMPLVTIKEGPSQEDWIRQKFTIKRLYLDENKPLKDVMSIMERKYGHKASITMYKNRIRNWKLDKKNKSNEVAIIMHKKAKRDAVGKASAFQLRGRQVDLEDVFRYHKRKKVPVPRVVTPDAATPPDMYYWTPPSSPLPRATIAGLKDLPDEGAKTLLENKNFPYDETSDPRRQWLFSPLPRPVSPPEHLVLSERLFNSIKIYFNGSLDNGTWVLNKNGDLVTARTLTAGKSQSLLNNIEQFSYLCNDSRSLLNAKDFVGAGQLLSKACDLIKDILVEEEPTTLERICYPLFQFLDAGFDDISTMLRNFISQMATNLLPLNHPWCQICKLIGSASVEDVQTLSRKIWKCTEDTLASRLGPFHSRVVNSELVFLSEIQILYDPISAERRLRQLSAGYKKVHGASNTLSTVIALNLGNNLNAQRRYHEALAWCEIYLVPAVDAGIGDYALSVIAESHYNLENKDQAIKTIRKSIKEISTKFGRTDPSAICYMGVLERWLRKWGLGSEADDVRAEIENLVGPADTDENLVS